MLPKDGLDEDQSQAKSRGDRGRMRNFTTETQKTRRLFLGLALRRSAFAFDFLIHAWSVVGLLVRRSQPWNHAGIPVHHCKLSRPRAPYRGVTRGAKAIQGRISNHLNQKPTSVPSVVKMSLCPSTLASHRLHKRLNKFPDPFRQLWVLGKLADPAHDRTANHDGVRKRSNHRNLFGI
jgi:hypothetical protein